MEDEFVPIGRVRTLNPGRRQVRVEPYPAHLAAFEALDFLWVTPLNGATYRCRVLTSRMLNELALLNFGPGVPCDLIGTMRNATVAIPCASLPKREASQWLTQDLVGVFVYTETETCLGEIVSVYETSANAALEIQRAEGGVFMLPLIEELLITVDVEKKRLVVGDITPYCVE